MRCLKMKFQTLRGKEVRLEINPSNFPIMSKRDCKSFGQFNLGRQIIKIYGDSCVLLEEFLIPDSRLSLDFYMPNNRLAFEFQGIQHDKFSKFFHQTRSGFDKQLERDRLKKVWCGLNKITLVEVRDPSISKEDLIDLIQTAREQEEENEQH